MGRGLSDMMGPLGSQRTRINPPRITVYRLAEEFANRIRSGTHPPVTYCKASVSHSLIVRSSLAVASLRPSRVKKRPNDADGAGTISVSTHLVPVRHEEHHGVDHKRHY